MPHDIESTWEIASCNSGWSIWKLAFHQDMGHCKLNLNCFILHMTRIQRVNWFMFLEKKRSGKCIYKFIAFSADDLTRHTLMGITDFMCCTLLLLLLRITFSFLLVHTSMTVMSSRWRWTSILSLEQFIISAHKNCMSSNRKLLQRWLRLEFNSLHQWARGVQEVKWFVQLHFRFMSTLQWL